MGLRQRLGRLYQREMFAPSLLGLLFNPLYIIRRGLYVGLRAQTHHLTGRVMDFGCGSKPYRSLIHAEEYVGVDIEVSGHSHENEDVDVYYDGHTIPFDDGYFDGILASEVFEHAFNLPDLLKELRRVLRPGGHMVLTVPFVWDEHELPYDFARYTSCGLEHLLTEAGFDIVASIKTTDYVRTVFQMWNAYVYQHVLPRSLVFQLALTPLLIAPVTALALVLSAVLPSDRHFYHNNVVVVRRPPTDSDLPAHSTGAAD